MARLFGFDYKRPFFYMVTLKKARGVKVFSEIGQEGLVANEITRRFKAVIRAFHKRWFVVAFPASAGSGWRVGEFMTDNTINNERTMGGVSGMFSAGRY